LPTVVDLAANTAGLTSDRLPAPIDGRSLIGALEGYEDADAAILGLYLAEAVAAPMMMVRQGRYKLIMCGSDPVQLFDLTTDPDENNNLAAAADHAAAVAAMTAIVEARFNAADIGGAVIASQQSRLAVFKALNKGKTYPWDYQPLRAASQQYTRNAQDVAQTDMTSRYPVAPPLITRKSPSQ
jgi:choline-sulfatase